MRPLLTLPKKSKHAPQEPPKPEGTRTRPHPLEAYHAHLRQAYPHLFTPKSEDCPLLAVGIHHELWAARPTGVSRGLIGSVLRDWTQRPRYRAAVLEGGPRYHLDGREQSEEEIARLRMTADLAPPIGPIPVGWALPSLVDSRQ